MVLALLPWAWHSLRLAIWGRFFGVNIAWKQLVRIAIATDVGGVVMPAAVGGAPLKASMLVQQGYRPGQAATLTLWGNVEDVLFFMIAIPVSIYLTKSWNNPLWKSAEHFILRHGLVIAAILIGLTLLAWWFLNSIKTSGTRSKWMDKIACVLTESLTVFSLILAKGRRPFIYSFLAVTAQWLTRFCTLLAVVRMLGLDADWLKLLLLQWMVFLAMMLTPTPGAIGGAEAGFLLVFAQSLPVGMIGLVLLAWRLATYYFMLGTGAVWLAATQTST